ncbi:MAG: hypothetical protein ACYTAF_00175 [Planctomycetota bacterium]|jgi:hypothetical protein
MMKPTMFGRRVASRALADRKGFLAGQILDVRVRWMGAAVNADQRLLIQMVESSLCMSYIFWTGGISSGTEVPRDALVCEGCSGGDVRVWFRGDILPVDARFLQTILLSADVLLVPGQLVIMDQRLADSVIDRSINNLVVDIAGIEAKQTGIGDILPQCDRARSSVVLVALARGRGEANRLRSRKAELVAASTRAGGNGGRAPGPRAGSEGGVPVMVQKQKEPIRARA